MKWLVISDPEEIRKLAGLTIDWMRMMAENDEAEHPLKQVFPAPVGLWDAGLDSIFRGASCLVYAYSESPLVYTDSIIALNTFDLMTPSFGFGICWEGLLQIGVMSPSP